MTNPRYARFGQAMKNLAEARRLLRELTREARQPSDCSLAYSIFKQFSTSWGCVSRRCSRSSPGCTA
jgi:hypothetical protein